MDNKMEDFKQFVKNNSFLIGYVRRGSKSWQDVYEMYDLYGDDEEAWGKFLEEETNRSSKVESSKGSYLNDIINMAKNVDVDKVQEGISSLQKTLGLFGELFVKKNSDTTNGKEYNPRPLYRRFED